MLSRLRSFIDFKISKRPLHRPAIPSPHNSKDQQKVIYISTKTPFLSAVKRAEKILHLSEKRLEQSATTLTNNKKDSKRQKNRVEEDEILEIAKAVEAEKKKRNLSGQTSGEEVVLKGTGKAIQKVMHLALWFQQRGEYIVRLRTRSVGAIDDIVGGEEEDANEVRDQKAVAGSRDEHGDEASAMDVDVADSSKDKRPPAEKSEELPETRVRYTSVLEVTVSLR